MRKATKIALATGALVLVGAGGIATLASADNRGGWRGHRGERFSRLMERFDTDKDGKLSQSELDDARRALLSRHDGDKDGKLTLAEFEKLWLEVMHRRMVRAFQRLDVDGDAQVTTDEFVKPFADLVERFDRNGDGVLDKEDRKMSRKHRGPGDGEHRDPGPRPNRG